VLRTRTSLIIAHRIATVKDADHIVVISQGQIAEQGRHADLVAANGLYARMVERELHVDQLEPALDDEAAEDRPNDRDDLVVLAAGD